MGEDTNLSTSLNDPIPLDPQLTSNSQSEARPDSTMLNTLMPDPIALDPRLTSMLQKALNPELIALDPQLTSTVVENDLTVMSQLTVENKSIIQPDTTQNQSPDKE